jgi:hypothetical protein
VKYTATVTFEVFDFEVESREKAEEKISGLIYELGDVNASLSWDNVEITLHEVEI